MPTSEVASVSARALDRDSAISIFLFVNDNRVAVSMDNNGGGSVVASAKLDSPER